MTKRLTTAQQQAYERDGFVAPVEIFSEDEMADIRAEIEAAAVSYTHLRAHETP